MQHPDEGTIHAWLDGALSPGEADALAAHVAGCATCAAAVAEARGLLAASSRILSALDTVPGGVIPEPMTSGARAAVRQQAVRRSLRVPNGLWRFAAAIVLFAAGAWAAERSAHAWRERETTPVVVAARYVDTTSYRVPGVVVDAPPSRMATGEMMVATAARVTAAPSAPRQEMAVLDQVAGAPMATKQLAGVESRVATPPSRVVTSDAHVSMDTTVVANRSMAPASQDMALRRTEATTQNREHTPRLVIDRAYVDSVLAADSSDATEGRPSSSVAGLVQGYSTGASSKAAAPAAAPAMPRAQALRARTDSPVMRAAGCWTVDTSAWSPARRADDETLLPPRVELRTDRGRLGDEWSELLVRPAPGEEAFPVGTAATWKPIGGDSYRLTVGDSTHWVVATITIAGDSLSGRVRDYDGPKGLIRTTAVTGRRVVCRTEP